MSDYERMLELNQLRADNFDQKISPHQKQYYLDLNEFYKVHPFETVEEATALIQGTAFYTGITLAKLLDEMHMGEVAMREVGYDDVADDFARRKEILKEKGYLHAYTQEWIDETNETEKIILKYAQRKEAFGKIYIGYVTLVGDVSLRDREEALKRIKEGFSDLAKLGTTFDEVASQRAYKIMTMLSDEGYNKFLSEIKGIAAKPDLGKEETHLPMDDQERAYKWAQKNLKEIMEIGKEEGWTRASCIAVPSDDPNGYDFIAMREGDY